MTGKYCLGFQGQLVVHTPCYPMGDAVETGNSKSEALPILSPFIVPEKDRHLKAVRVVVLSPLESDAMVVFNNKLFLSAPGLCISGHSTKEFASRQVTNVYDFPHAPVDIGAIH